MKEAILVIIFLLAVIGGYLAWCRSRIRYWKRRAECTEAVTATLTMKFVTGSGGKRNRRCFQFAYAYHGEQKVLSLDEPNAKDYKQYMEGGQYTIYVNPAKPHDIRYRELEKKYSFLLYTVRGILFLFSWCFSLPFIMMNVQELQNGGSVTFFDWLAPIIWIAILVGCIISINRD